jgi:predicted O-linked N-acetylglucosamine transferase (SPINDLY family)
MPSRMGASLLKACGLNALITETIDQYVDVAIQLGSSISQYDLIKKIT